MSGSSNFTLTPKLGLYKPTFNADVDAWGGHWNTNADTLDGMLLPVTGGTMTGPLNYTATGTTTSRSAQDRAADWVNVKDFGAKLDGVTDDSPAFNAARTAAVRGQTIYVPEGKLPSAGIAWSAPDMTKQVRWLLDGGVTFPLGGAVITLGPTNSGDITEGTLLNPNGIINFLGKRTNPTLATDLTRMDYILDGAGGLGQIGSGITMNGVINDGNDSAMWLMNIVADSNASNPASSGLVGLSVTTRKNAAANTQGIHISALDTTGLPSSSNGGRGFSALESANRANGIDDAPNTSMWGGIGVRVNTHISSTLQQSLTNETNFSYMVWGGPDAAAPHLYVKSMYGISVGAQTYQVFDARGGVPPYVSTNPVIALNMQSGMVVDFNGGPALNSAPGNYLQYTTTGTPRLRYMKGTTELWSVSDTGAGYGAFEVNVRAFGAVGDGVADDTTEINAALDYIRAHVVVNHATWRLVFPPGRYLVTAPLNFTGLASLSGGGVIDGQGSEIWAKHTGIVIDALGSRWLRFRDLTVFGDATTIPRIGIQIGRNVSAVSADYNAFHNVRVNGSYTFTAYYNNASEMCAHYTSEFRNDQSGANKFCMVLDGLNHWNVSSTFVAVTAAVETLESFIGNLFSACTWQGGASTNGIIWMGSVSKHRYDDCYASCTAGNIFTIYQLASAGPAAVQLDIDCHCETVGLQYAVMLTSAPGQASTYIIDFHFQDHASQAATSILAIDPASSLTGAALRGAQFHIGRAGGFSPTLFDTPSKWSVTAEQAILDPGMWAAPAVWIGPVIDSVFGQTKSFDVAKRWVSSARPTVSSGAYGFATDQNRFEFYDGTSWYNFARLTGDTFSGGLGIGLSASASAALTMNAAVNTLRRFDFSTAGVLRWRLMANSTAEGGAADGCDFVLQSFDNTGATLTFPLSVQRSSGMTTLTSLRVSGNAGFNNTLPIAKPTVSGAKGSNAALASLITALAAYGLITDSSTA